MACFIFAFAINLTPVHAAGFTDVTIGNDSAPIKMEIFNDFQCPFCARFHQTLSSGKIRRLITRKELQIIIRDFPLSFHQNAENAAKAANAANSVSKAKGRQMVDLLFRNQERWSEKGNPLDTFIEYAKRLNIDSKTFKDAYHSAENQREIQQDIDEGTGREISGTPTYFINGREYVGANPLEALMEQIESER